MEGHVIGQQNLNDSPGERGLRLSNKEGKNGFLEVLNLCPIA